MISNERPIIKIKKSRIDFVMEYTAIANLLFMWMFTYFHYEHLPGNIPIHFDLSGNADNFGNKNSLWLLPIIVTIFILLLRMLSRYPHKFNYISKITNENAERQYKLSVRLLRYLQVSLAVLFTYINMRQIKGFYQLKSTLDWWFIPLLFAVILIPTFYVMYNLSQKANN